MNTKQLKYVLMLANCGSFSKAAAELNITQPSLSQYIKKIEADAGTELFERSGSFVRLTDAGMIFVETGRRILALEEEMQNRFSDISENRNGTLTIGISAHRSVSLMPPVVAAFREKYPGICVILKEYLRDELICRAERGEFDLCITTPPVTDRLFEICASFREEILLAVNPSSPLCCVLDSRFPSGTVEISALDGSDFAMLNEGHPMQAGLDELCFSNGLRLNKTVECSSLETLLAMVKEGLGAALIPACLGSPGNGVRFFHIAGAVPRREILLIRNRDRYLPVKVSDMIDISSRILGDYFS